MTAQGPSLPADVELSLAVVIPCHNSGSTLAEQLDRLVDERWTRRWGIVVVDNGSTDDTRVVVNRFLERGVSVVSATEKYDAGYARNAGVRSVRASAIAFCDGDDVIQPGWVAAIGDALDQHELVGGRLETETLNDPWLATSRPLTQEDGLARFAGTPFVPTCNCGVRRELFDRLGGFDENFDGLEDIEFSLRARSVGVIASAAPGATVSYRFRSTARELWRQGRYYGEGRPLLIQRARELGLPAPGRAEGVRSWAWLLMHLPWLRHRQGRYRLLWVAAFRVGVLRRAVRLRRFYI